MPKASLPLPEVHENRWARVLVIAHANACKKARALELSAAFLQYVKKCPHVMESVQA